MDARDDAEGRARTSASQLDLDKARERWETYRCELVAGKRSESAKYDSAVLLVAAAFLAFSVNFFRGPDDPSGAGFLLAGWILLALAVASNIAGNLVSWFTFDYLADRVTAVCRELDSARLPAAGNVDFCRNVKLLKWLNVATAVLILAGIAMLLVYGYINL